MEQLDFLEMELNMLQDNIKRVKQFKKENESRKLIPSSSLVVGELKYFR